jgi:hypothetical protein
VLLKNVKLLNTAIDIVTSRIPGVGNIMLLKIGIEVREVSKSLLIADRSPRLRNSN